MPVFPRHTATPDEITALTFPVCVIKFSQSNLPRTCAARGGKEAVMRYEPREITLRDGTRCLLRSAEESDAPAMLEHRRITAGETEFLLRYPEEVTMPNKQERDFLRNNLESPGNVMIAAFVGDSLVGTAGVQGIGSCTKIRHRCSLGIALKQAFWGNGLGTALMETALNAASAMGFEQIELGVYRENTRAIRLYKRMGFQCWGATPHAFKLKGGHYIDELLMGKFLTGQG